ncbi:MAG: hypothetical protein AB7I27_01290 [Bacteriovoracaceae bacterium]
MYGLIPLLLISFAFAEIAPKCERLGNYIQEFDLNLAQSSPENCLQLDSTGLKAQDDKIFNEFKCENFSSIEAKLKDLESQLDYLTGLEKLKANIKAQKEKTADKNAPLAQEAGMNFQDALITAQSFELLLSAKDSEGNLLFKELRKIPKDKREDLKSFGAELKKICKKNFQDQAACNENFWRPNEAAIVEINALLDKKDSKDKEILSWQSSLQIQKTDNSPYSFNEMRQDLEASIGDQGSKPLTKAQLKAIQSLPDFKNASGLKFISSLAQAKKDLTAETPYAQFRFLAEDLKKRQEFEIQSKVSLLYGEFQDKLTNRDSCSVAKVDFSAAQICLKQLKDLESGLQGSPQAHLKKLREVLEASINYHDSIDDLTSTCQKSVKMDEVNCDRKISFNQAEIQKQIQSLNLLKDKIGEKNQDLMKLRNFSIEKFQKMDCAKKEASNITDCDAGLTLRTSKEANLLTADVMNISLVYAKSENETDIQEICDDEEKKIIRKAQVCAFLTDTTPDKIETKNTEKIKRDDYVAPTSAPDGGNSPVKDAIYHGMTNLISEMMDQYQQQNSSYSPYQYYNYSPYNNGAPLMSTSDSILFNARYYGGYGFYMPTLGYQPYQAFGPYRPYNLTNSSTYFNAK